MVCLTPGTCSSLAIYNKKIEKKKKEKKIRQAAGLQIILDAPLTMGIYQTNYNKDVNSGCIDLLC